MKAYIPWTSERLYESSWVDVQEKLQEAQAEIERLSSPPKDLSDPYPKDGPNVRHQDKHDALLQRLRELERVPGADKKIRLLEARLTALSETVAKNRIAAIENNADNGSAYNALHTQVIALECKTPSEPERGGDNRELMALERRVNGLDCERRRQAEKLEVLSETMTSGSLSVTSDGIRFYTERRVEQRRCNQGDRRHTSIQQRLAGRRGDDDRRQP